MKKISEEESKNQISDAADKKRNTLEKTDVQMFGVIPAPATGGRQTFSVLIPVILQLISSFYATTLSPNIRTTYKSVTSIIKSFLKCIFHIFSIFKLG